MTTLPMDASAGRAGDRVARLGRPLTWLAFGFVATAFAVGGRLDVAPVAWIAPIFWLRCVRTSRLSISIPIIWLVSFADAFCWLGQVGPPQTSGPEGLELIAFGTIYVPAYTADRLIAPRLGVVGNALFPPAAAAVRLLPSAR